MGVGGERLEVEVGSDGLVGVGLYDGSLGVCGRWEGWSYGDGALLEGLDCIQAYIVY